MSKEEALEEFKKSFAEKYGEKGSLHHISAENSDNGKELIRVTVTLAGHDAEEIDDQVHDLIIDSDLDDYFAQGHPHTGFGWREIKLYAKPAH
jgi:hypothetical protein